jgi:Rrf2 family iron-sulfur cluster assembly transcriptional regulator
MINEEAAADLRAGMNLDLREYFSDIIMAVDEPIRATRCKSGSPRGCHADKSRCLTHDLWEELGNQIYLFLSTVSLADICERRVLGIRGFLGGEPREGARAAE